MDTADILQMISFAAFISAGVFLVAAVILFFCFRIPKVAGELSGKSAKKSIRKIRETNEKNVESGFQRGMINRNRGVLTETVSSGMRQEHELSNRIFYETGILDENKAENADADPGETTLLEGQETTLPDSSQVGGAGEYTEELSAAGCGIRLDIIDEVMFVHTNEAIKQK